MKKLKLDQSKIRKLSEKELSRILGGIVSVTTGPITSASSGPSSSTSITNGTDYDTSTGDSDAENDSIIFEDDELLRRRAL